MFCIKNLQNSTSVLTAEKVNYKNMKVLAVSIPNAIQIYSLDMKLLEEINLYSPIIQIIPLNDSFLCFTKEYYIHFSKTKKKYKFNSEIKKVFNSKNYFLLLTNRLIVGHKTSNTFYLDEKLKDLFYLDIIDIATDNNNLFVLFNEIDRQAKGCEVHTLISVLSIFKYHNKQFILIETLKAPEIYKIIFLNNLIMFDINNVYILKSEMKKPQESPKELLSGFEVENNEIKLPRKKEKIIKNAFEHLFKINCEKIKLHIKYNNGMILLAENNEIFFIDEEYKMISKGFLNAKVDGIVYLKDNFFYGYSKNENIIYFQLTNLGNSENISQKENQHQHNKDEINRRYDVEKNIDLTKKRKIEKENLVNEFFENKEIHICKEFKNLGHIEKINFKNNNLIITHKNYKKSYSELSYKIKYKCKKEVQFNDKIRDVFIFENNLFISFYDYFILYDIFKEKINYKQENCIKNFYKIETKKENNNFYILNTKAGIVSNDEYFSLDYEIILSSYYKNKMLFYGKKNNSYFLLLCENEILVLEKLIDFNISFILLNELIYISTYENVFYIQDYKFNTLKEMLFETIKYGLFLQNYDLLLFSTLSGSIFLFYDTFVKIMDLKQIIFDMKIYDKNMIYIKAESNYLLKLNLNAINDKINNSIENISICQIYEIEDKNIKTIGQIDKSVILVQDDKISIANKNFKPKLKIKEKPIKYFLYDQLYFKDKTLNIEININENITQQKNIFNTYLKLYKKEKNISRLRVKKYIYKQCKQINNNIFVLALNSQEMKYSKIILLNIDKKIQETSHVDFEAYIQFINFIDDILVITFLSEIKIYKLFNSSFIQIAFYNNLAHVTAIVVDKMDSLYDIFVNDRFKGFLNFRFDDETNQITTNFINFLKVKEMLKYNENEMLILTDNNSILKYNKISNIFNEIYRANYNIYSIILGNLEPFKYKNIYIATEYNEIKSIIDLKCIFDENEIYLLQRIQNEIYKKDNFFTQDLEYINFDLIFNESSINILKNINCDLTTYEKLINKIKIIK